MQRPEEPIPLAGTAATLHGGGLDAAAADAPPVATGSALPAAPAGGGLGVAAPAGGGVAQYSCVPSCECQNQPGRWSHCLECPRQTCDLGPCGEEGWGYSDARDGWLCPAHAPARRECHACGLEGTEEEDGYRPAVTGEAAGEWHCGACLLAGAWCATCRSEECAVDGHCKGHHTPNSVGGGHVPVA